MAVQQRVSEVLHKPNSDNDDDGMVADIESEEDDGGKNNSKNQGMAAMADIISKILAKPSPASGTAILSKSKKSQKRKLEMKEELLSKKEKADERIDKREKNHVLPTRSNAQKEVLLKRIATKGVVKLFNAVSAHQKLASEKMKEAKTESRMTKAAETLTKSSFMDLLKNKQGKNPKNQAKKDTKYDDGEQKKKWDVLRDDFMMGASMKDWDKTNETEEQEDAQTESDDDGESE